MTTKRYILLCSLILAAFVVTGAVSSFYIKDNQGHTIPFGTGGSLTFPNITGSPNDITVIFDHFDLENAGTNTHAQIDTHVGDGTIHFSEGSIDHSNLQNSGTQPHSALDAHLADTTEHFTQAEIDHSAIQGAGTYTHAQLDTHVDDGTIHAPIFDNLSATVNTLWSGAFTKNYIDTTGGGGGVLEVTDDTITVSLVDRIRFDPTQGFVVSDAGNNDATVGFTLPDIDHDTLTNAAGYYNHSTLNAHVDDPDVHFLASSLTHDALDGAAGYSNHSTIDAHLSDSALHGGGGGTALTVTDDTTTITDVDTLRFTPFSGFSVADDGNGDVSISLGSSWNPIQVAGQTDLDATGEEALEIEAGAGIVLTTNTASTPKRLTISNSNALSGGSVLDNTDTAPSPLTRKATLYLSGPTSPDAFTKLLIQSEAPDGSQLFVDSSSSAHSIGFLNCTHSETQSIFGTSSIRTNNTYLSVASDPDFAIGTQDFTVDFWVYPYTYTNNNDGGLFSIGHFSNFGFRVYGNKIGYYFGDYVPQDISRITTPFHANTWHHVAGVRNGDTFTMYINGTPARSSNVSSASIAQDTVYIGRNGEFFTRYIDAYYEEIRLSVGVARWTAAFTPPSGPYGGPPEQKLMLMLSDGTAKEIQFVP